MRHLAWVAVLLAVTAGAQEAEPIRVGQAVWRASATTRERPQADGGTRPMQLDAYTLSVAEPTRVLVRLRAEGRLGLVVIRLPRSGAGPAEQLGAAPPGRALDLSLTPGDYRLMVAGEPPSPGAYLLSVATPPTAEETLARRETATATDGPTCLGAWTLPHGVTSLDVSPDGGWIVAADESRASLVDPRTGARYALPAPPGPIRRVGVSRDGWVAMVATAGGARLLSLPELAEITTIGSEAELADACLTGELLRVAMLPVAGDLSIRSPDTGDVAGLPDSAGARLATDRRGERLAVLRADGTVSLFDVGRRRLLERRIWPAPPALVALDPLRPVIVGTGAGTSGLWLAQPGGEVQRVPDLAAAAYGPNGELAVADAEGVVLRLGEDEANVQPTVAADVLAMDARGKLLAAATRAGEITVWNTVPWLPDRVLESADLQRARAAYESGTAAFGAGDFDRARRSFAAALEMLVEAPDDEPHVVRQRCLALLRLSECHWALKEYGTSLEQARQLEARAPGVPDPEQRSFLVAMARYRQADALWEMGRRDEAKPVLEAALAAGLTGPAADDARAKLGQ